MESTANAAVTPSNGLGAEESVTASSPRQSRILSFESTQSAPHRTSFSSASSTGAISPPGGVYQDGPHIGKPALDEETAFKVFIICNAIALFLSLSMVLMLISIIPFRRKAMMRMLLVANRTTWVATVFLASAYIAARYAMINHTGGTKWMFQAEVSIGGGLLALSFVVSNIMLLNNKMKKAEWKREKGKPKVPAPHLTRSTTRKPTTEEDGIQDVDPVTKKTRAKPFSIHSISSVSDLESNILLGFHNH